jgi:hypothetical protein
MIFWCSLDRRHASTTFSKVDPAGKAIRADGMHCLISVLGIAPLSAGKAQTFRGIVLS